MNTKTESQLPFLESIFVRKVVQICDNVGYNAITQDSSNILVDIYQKTIFHLGRHCKEAANSNRRNESTLTDLSQAFANVGVSLAEIEEHIDKVKLPFPVKIEQPEPQESRLQRKIIEEDGLEDEKKDEDNLSDNGLDEDDKPAISTLKDTYLEIISQFPPVEVKASSKVEKSKKAEVQPKPAATISPYIPVLEIKSYPSTSRNHNESDFRHTIPRVSIVKHPKGKKKKSKRNQFAIVTEPVTKDDTVSIAAAESARAEAAKLAAAQAKADAIKTAAAKAEAEAEAEAARAAAARVEATKVAAAKASAEADKTDATRSSTAKATSASIDSCPECYQPDDGTLMIQCDRPTCAKWFHGKCVGLLNEPKKNKSWICKACKACDYIEPDSRQSASRVSSAKHQKTKKKKSKRNQFAIVKESVTKDDTISVAVAESDEAEAAKVDAAEAASARLSPAEVAAAAIGCKVEDLCPECYLPDDGTLMIQCDRPTCAKWFHGKCVGLHNEPKEDESWICKACKACDNIKPDSRHSVSRVSSAKHQKSKKKKSKRNQFAIVKESVTKDDTTSGAAAESVGADTTKVAADRSSPAEVAAAAIGCKVEDLCPECYLPDDGTLMIQCDQPTCARWFHGKCVGLLNEPKEDESWLCKACVGLKYNS